MLVPRHLEARVRGYLRIFPAVALVGSRQVGKTTLARAIARVGESADAGGVYLDLENPADLEKLDDPGAYLLRHRGRLVVLDEIHRKPALFEVLRGVIDDRVAKRLVKSPKVYIRDSGIVHGREGRFPKGGGVEAMDLSALLDDLRASA